MKALPANRVAALATFITGLAGCGTALAQVWPNSTTNEIALIAGSLATAAGPLAHIVGSWLWDRTPVGQQQALAQTTPLVTVNAGEAAENPIPSEDDSADGNSFAPETRFPADNPPFADPSAPVPAQPGPPPPAPQ